ncbi:MAG: DegT/DnrJ/EryC1/StrS family aminotransferase [Gammaproteobacteria bacterium]|nr:DegT/DnrJ/EryC1/StrS family aminotransferase [Gammaproteobacteria bacterium]
MIQVFKPFFGEEEVDAVREVLESGWAGLGPKTAQFEKEFSEYIGVDYTIGVNSATSALDLALKLLEVGHGDEVLVPTMTFVSTGHVVAYNLATPIFVDCDPETMCIDLEDVARKITRRTKAIIPVHYGGRPVDIDALREVVGDIPIIEDAAHACGSVYKNKKVGSLADIGCFSFQAVKNLAMGDGGALTLNSPELADRAKRLRWLGIDKGTWDRTATDTSYWWEYQVDEVGLKCHLNDIAAAIGIVQLHKLDSMNARRNEVAARYTAAFAACESIKTPPPIPDDWYSSGHIYCIRVPDRNKLSVYLQDNGVATGVHYKPIHTYKCYGNRPVLPNAEAVFEQILSLPMYPSLTDDEVDTVINTVLGFYK